MARRPSPDRKDEIYVISRNDNPEVGIRSWFIFTFLPFVCTEGPEGDWLVLDDIYCDFFENDDPCLTFEEVSIKSSLKYGVDIDMYAVLSDIVTIRGHYVGREDHVARYSCIRRADVRKIRDLKS